MARPIVLSNGELHVGINRYGLVHDFYFPYVGLENHSAGKSLRHRVGAWVDGQISWLDNEEWVFRFRYPARALVGHTIARNDRLGVLLEFDDVVDANISAFMRNIHVVNLRENQRNIRLFTHQAFAIGDARSDTDTGQYLPDSHAILHYRGRRAFVVSGTADGKPFDQHTVGLFGIEGYEGTFRDADDGELSFCNVEHGRVDSTLRFSLDVPGFSSKRVHYWIAAGTSLREALYIDKQVREDGVVRRLHDTAKWWQTWLQPAVSVAEKLAPEYQEQFIRSTMIIKSQMDKRGAVLASTDTTMLNYYRDAYAYCWPRDGAYVVWPLVRMGYIDEPRLFFDFCRRAMHPAGYVMHKYRADGALGSSWHPYTHEDGSSSPPIQEDETALVLFVFAQFYFMHRDTRMLGDFYDSMIKPMAHFMATYIEPVTGLPKPSYDLWEEHYLTTTYSTSVTYAALLAAADLADEMDDADNAVRWRAAADDIAEAARKHLYNHSRHTFYKGIIVKHGEIERDETIDSSSTFGAFMFGLFPLESEELTSAINTLSERFGLNGGGIGLPRYENDPYFRAGPDAPSNWWIICTLWMAQYQLERKSDDAALRIVDWVMQHSNETGILPEQIGPLDGHAMSVEPLTWSHAEHVATLLDTIRDDEK